MTTIYATPKSSRVLGVLLAAVLSLLGSLQPLNAEPTAKAGLSPEEATRLIREAAQATEHAWEEFHAAAIGGTLASPLVQVTIESQLHEARALLMKARIARRDKQYEVVNTITTRIQEITQQIIQASRERKQ